MEAETESRRDVEENTGQTDEINEYLSCISQHRMKPFCDALEALCTNESISFLDDTLPLFYFCLFLRGFIFFLFFVFSVQ